MNETLVYLEEERILAVKSVDIQYTEPQRVTLYWPVLRECRPMDAQAYAIGHELQARTTDGGQYVYSYDPNMPEHARRTIFQLEHGGRTQAVRVETERIPPPKVRRGTELRWRDGRWEKYLKARGWVSA